MQTNLTIVLIGQDEDVVSVGGRSGIDQEGYLLNIGSGNIDSLCRVFPLGYTIEFKE